MFLQQNEYRSGAQQQFPDTLTLLEAHELAVNDKTGWCIVPLGFDLTVAKLEIDDDLRMRRIRGDSGKLLRFPTIQEARQFLLSTLGIPRTMLLLA